MPVGWEHLVPFTVALLIEILTHYQLITDFHVFFIFGCIWFPLGVVEDICNGGNRFAGLDEVRPQRGHFL